MKWLLTFCLFGLPLAFSGQTNQDLAVAVGLMGGTWSEGVQGMTAVREVIHQRALAESRTPLQIIAARWQGVQAISSLNGTPLDGLIQNYRRQPDDQAGLQLAQTVYQDQARLPGLTKATNRFTRATERPYWTKGKRPVTVIGRHAFFRLKHC